MYLHFNCISTVCLIYMKDDIKTDETVDDNNESEGRTSLCEHASSNF